MVKPGKKYNEKVGLSGCKRCKKTKYRWQYMNTINKNMKLFTVIGTRLRLEPCISSLITKSYYENDVELKFTLTESKEDGFWYYVTDGENKGWVRLDFLKRLYE